jgi:hypothetical protein
MQQYTKLQWNISAVPRYVCYLDTSEGEEDTKWVRVELDTSDGMPR